MKKLLSALLLGFSLFAPIQVKAHNDTYTPCKVGDAWLGCHWHHTDSTNTSRQYSFHTIGEEYNIVFDCESVKFSNQKTNGTLTDLKTNKAYPISCVFAVSTRSNRSFIVYNRGARDPIFRLNIRHNVGR